MFGDLQIYPGAGSFAGGAQDWNDPENGDSRRNIANGGVAGEHVRARFHNKGSNSTEARRSGVSPLGRAPRGVRDDGRCS